MTSKQVHDIVLILLLASSSRSASGGAADNEAHSCAGFYFRQLTVGVDIARPSTSRGAAEDQLFALAAQMKNFVYVFGDLEGGVAAVVDGTWDVRGIERIVNEDGLNLTAAIATHFHWDHIGSAAVERFGGLAIPGIRELAALPSVAHVHVPRWELDAAAKQTQCAREALTALDESTTIEIGRFVASFTHTPGHSPGSVCIAVSEREASAAASAAASSASASGSACGGEALLLITGDTLFPGSCGRLDLPGSDARVMYDSLRKLSDGRFKDDLTVYPGHSYGGASSTIGRERTNGLLREMTRGEWNRRMV